MLEAAIYSAVESLADGRRVEIRALRPDDRADFLAALERTSSQSLYRRFFTARRGFAEAEIAHFLNVDFVSHVALVAVMDEAGGPALVGSGRYVVLQPGRAELAFAVVDQYQGRGIGAALMRHLAAIARDAGIKEFVADILPGNTAMLRVFEKSGLDIKTRHGTGAVHVILRLS